MARSIKKGPYIDHNVEKKVSTMNAGNKKSVIKTWSRRSMISPDFVGHTFAVHNGNKFIPVYVTENMVGHKLGEFSPTRNLKSLNRFFLSSLASLTHDMLLKLVFSSAAKQSQLPIRLLRRTSSQRHRY